MKKNWKKVLYIAAPVAWAAVLYLGGTGSLGTVLARTVTTVLQTMTQTVKTVQPDGSDGPASTEYTDTLIETIVTYEEVTEQTVPEEKPHQHSFSWEVETEATENTDAILVEKCSGCGQERKRMTGAGTAVYQFLDSVTDKIEKAKNDETVVVNTHIWTCFNQKVLDTLAERPDVNLEVHYCYQGVKYVLTIPAGADLEAIKREDGFYGFRYLDKVFGGQEEIQ